MEKFWNTWQYAVYGAVILHGAGWIVTFGHSLGNRFGSLKWALSLSWSEIGPIVYRNDYTGIGILFNDKFYGLYLTEIFGIFDSTFLSIVMTFVAFILIKRSLEEWVEEDEESDIEEENKGV